MKNNSPLLVVGRSVIEIPLCQLMPDCNWFNGHRNLQTGKKIKNKKRAFKIAGFVSILIKIPPKAKSHRR